MLLRVYKLRGSVLNVLRTTMRTPRLGRAGRGGGKKRRAYRQKPVNYWAKLGQRGRGSRKGRGEALKELKYALHTFRPSLYDSGTDIL